MSQETQWPLEAGNKPQFIATKKTGPQFYNFKEMNSDKNLNRQDIDYPVEPPERNTPCCFKSTKFK